MVMTTRLSPTKHNINRVYEWLETVPDPEIPVLSVIDLGIIQSVAYNEDVLEIGLIPTYSGCPALEVFEEDISSCLKENGVKDFKINRLLYPSWSTDMISELGKEKLLKYGISPPQKTSACGSKDQHKMSCPQCGSTEVKLISAFGSTPCKSLHSCCSCMEPFEHFKCI